MQIGLALNFEGNASLGDLYRVLFDRFVKFTPKSTTYNKRVKDWDPKKHLPLLDSCDLADMLSFGARGEMFYYSLIPRPHPYRSIKIIQNSQSFCPGEEEVSSIVERPGFIAGFIYNEDYDYVQSVPGDYYGNRYNEFSPEILASLKNTPYETISGGKRYHTEFNPGRSLEIDHLQLLIAWKMLFGPGFFKLVPKERIMSFPYATTIKELSDNLLYVQLYDNVEEPYIPENVFRQWKWREWIDYDGLEVKYKW